MCIRDRCIEEWNCNGLQSSRTIAQYGRYAVVFATVFIMCVSCYTDYLLTNKAYLRMDFAEHRVNNYFNRIIASVEVQEGYQNGDEVALIGNFYYRINPSVVEIDVLDSESLRELSGVALENGMMTSGARDSFIRDYVGFDVAHLSEKDKLEIAATDEFHNMPDYPSEGSIQKINGMWIVKLCEYEE